MRDFILSIIETVKDLILIGKIFWSNWLEFLKDYWNTSPDFQYWCYVIGWNVIAWWIGVIVGKAVCQTKDDFKKTKNRQIKIKLWKWQHY